MAKAKKKNKVKVPNQAAEMPDLPADIEKVISDSVKAAANSSVVPPVLMKVCRLCGGKEGPFLNIFDQDQSTAIKIDQLMPFRIEENDDLPHKICFRCSAKLEELHEFVSKCIKTQENLHTNMGKKPPVISRTNTRQMWEEKLYKSNMTNEDICNALIKKAMEGIKDISRSPTPDEEPVIAPKNETRIVNKPGPWSKKVLKKIEEENNVQFKEVKLSLDKCDELPKRSLRSKTAEKPPESPVERRLKPTREATKPVIQDSSSSDDDEVEEEPNVNKKITSLSFDFDEGPIDNKKNKVEESIQKKTEPEPPEKPFNIMDHICMIKVNGVGVLFQCKLCNRNFLKKEVVQTHSCAKNGIPKVDLTKNIKPPEPPKIATVKYINTKVDDAKKAVVKEEPVKPPLVKPKPRIGPASRVKHNSDTGSQNPNTSQNCNTSQQITQNPQQFVQPTTPNPQPAAPVVNFPSMPGLNGRFRLVPGPNNTFTLCEDNSIPSTITPAPSLTNNVNVTYNVSPPISNNIPSQISAPIITNKNDTKKSRKRKSNIPVEENSKSLLKPQFSAQSVVPNQDIMKSRSFIDLVDSEERPQFTITSRNPTPVAQQPVINSVHDQPYPVGLFQTVSRAPEPPAFTTPAMKKQSYTIVQTGNPSKLLISTKPQPVEEAPKKKKKPKLSKAPEEESPPSFNVTLEDTTRAKDSGFFTFINVDPLLQPSYVLPTDNIIQESQISTSTAMVQPPAASKDKDKYSCNMCDETFSREKKLLAHIQSHFTKMDEEDQRRAEKSEPRKRSKRL
ncbi:uncharacterized protein LOC128678197 [Plodia interpunctella]|uniref:uncharacterized protein LOC128678197 n=1 Tax=Plodia interpunctella TaxID=58824 RepID=UPI002368C08C|nr:uncharacterized protein LOC128678197 [Plodia interpunctella]